MTITASHSQTFNGVILSHPEEVRRDLSEFWKIWPTVSWYVTVGQIKLTSTPDLHTSIYISATVIHYSYYAWVTCAPTSLFFLPSWPSPLVCLSPTHCLWAWHKLYVYLWKVKLLKKTNNMLGRPVASYIEVLMAYRAIFLSLGGKDCLTSRTKKIEFKKYIAIKTNKPLSC